MGETGKKKPPPKRGFNMKDNERGGKWGRAPVFH